MQIIKLCMKETVASASVDLKDEDLYKSWETQHMIKEELVSMADAGRIMAPLASRQFWKCGEGRHAGLSSLTSTPKIWVLWKGSGVFPQGPFLYLLLPLTLLGTHGKARSAWLAGSGRPLAGHRALQPAILGGWPCSFNLAIIRSQSECSVQHKEHQANVTISSRDRCACWKKRKYQPLNFLLLWEITSTQHL